MATARRTRRTSTTSSSSGRAAPACARPSRPPPRACRSASSASRSSARPTRSWPRAASPRPWATCGRRTTGRCTSATPCAAARCSTTGAWPSSTPRRRPSGCWSWSAGARCSTAPRTGCILQRDFGGHRYARLAHVGDRTGLEMIRTLQYHGIHQGIDVYMECKIRACSRTATGSSGAVGYWRKTGEFVVFKAKAVVLATGGIGKAWKVTSNSWEYTGDGQSLALWAGADLIDMEFVQFHPTGMVWPPSVRGILVTEGVRGDGGHAEEQHGRAVHVQLHPGVLQGRDGRQRGGGRPLVRRQEEQPAHARPAAARRGGPRHQLRGQGRAGQSPHGGVFLDICTRRPADYIRKRLPSMYHQFKELAGVDITKEPMEVGPTCHYVMGGVRVDADTTAGHRARALRRRRGARAACTASNRLGGNSLSDLLVFGRRAGLHAALYAKNFGGQLTVDSGVRWSRSRARRWRRSSAPAARTPTPSRPSCRRPCRPWSASSAPRPS